ncbi:cysteine-rich receptor-like protein kinase [Tanacetum coccineum]
MRMPTTMLIESSTLWVDRLTPGAVNTWDLLKKAFIQRYCPPSKTAKRLEDIYNLKQKINESLYQAWERFNDLIYKHPTHGINSHLKVNIIFKGFSTMNRQLLESQGPIPRMTPTQALMAIQSMADDSQKWHDGTLSRSLSSSSNTNGLAVIISKLDNLGRDMKKLKENVHAIQVGCQICEGSYLDKECPLNEEAKQVEEVKYGEFGHPALFNGNNEAKYHVGLPGYYTRTDNRPPYEEKRPKVNTRDQSISLKNLETQIDQLTKELHSRATNKIPSSSIGQCKVVNDDLEMQHRPISSRKLINKEGWTTKDLQCQLPPKELNPGNFTLPYTIGDFNFYGMADLGANVNVMPRNIFEYLKLANLRKTNMLVEMADMTKKAPLGKPFLATIHAKINVFDKEISLGTNDDRVSYDMEKRDQNFTIPTKKFFMIKSDLDNRPLTLASSNNQPRNLHDRYPFDYRVTLGFGSILGGLDPVSPVIRLPIKRGINSVVARNTFEGNALYPWIPALEQSNNLGGARIMGEKESKALMLNDREKQAITEAKSNSIHGNI